MIKLSTSTFRLKDIYSTLNSALLLWGKHQTEDDKVKNNKEQGDKTYEDHLNQIVAIIFLAYVVLALIINIIHRILLERKKAQRISFE